MREMLPRLTGSADMIGSGYSFTGMLIPVTTPRKMGKRPPESIRVETVLVKPGNAKHGVSLQLELSRRDSILLRDLILAAN